MNARNRLAAALLLLVACWGCSSIAMPDWAHPGSAEVQRRRALQYDPYLESEPGPAIPGVRPREYDKPPPEPSRARWFLGKWGDQ
jgi:hypothetical protein